MSGARSISGWWRIGIVLCVLSGAFIGFVGNFSRTLYFEKGFADEKQASQWLPDDCSSATVTREIETTKHNFFGDVPANEPMATAPATTESLLSAPTAENPYDKIVAAMKPDPSVVKINCQQSYWQARAVAASLGAAGIVALACYTLGWVVAGFRRLN